MIVFKSKVDTASYKKYLQTFIKSFSVIFSFLALSTILSVIALAFFDNDDSISVELNIAFLTLLGVILILTICSFLRTNKTVNRRIRYSAAFLERSEIVEIDYEGIRRTDEFAEENTSYFKISLISNISREKSGLYVITFNNGTSAFFKPTEFLSGNEQALMEFFSSLGIIFRQKK